MTVAIVTGSCGLIGSEAVRFLARRGLDVVGVDNDMRRTFFGDEASTSWNRRRLEHDVPNYRHVDADIRDESRIDALFREFGRDVEFVVHCAAQPSHDWAARDPRTDFTVNALGTLVLLEAARKHCPTAPFAFTSTNKVYGDAPNHLPLVEHETRFELDPSHPYAEHGIDESLSIDQSVHSVFGASKVAADVMVQEYGRNFGMPTACFRGGCLTGPAHSGAELHGFLAYLMWATLTGRPYTIHGHRAKQVRDNIHAHDLVSMLWHFKLDPHPGEVYNVGGGRHSNCSMLEAISLCEQISGRTLDWTYSEKARTGDHVWWISDVSRFRSHYPAWRWEHDLRSTLVEIHEAQSRRLREAAPSSH
ncbi:MAG: NAD-dependent epimerase/dehydratase family protein [Planctomycetota bacterium]